MLSIKKIDKVRMRIFDGKATDKEINKVFCQAIFAASLVEFIEGRESLNGPYTRDDLIAGHEMGFNECLKEIKAFIKENQ